MLKILIQGGPLLWLIIIAAIAALALFLERWFHIHRAKIRTADFLSGIFNILARHNIAEALTICKETPGPVAGIMQTAVMHYSQKKEAIELAIDETAMTEISRLERHFATLATIAQMTPIIGLLGTVMGLIQAFIVIQQKAPLVQAGDLAGAVWMALITTAAGLIVAVFCYFGYNLLVVKVAAIVLDMKQAANEISGFLASRRSDLPEEPRPQ